MFSIATPVVKAAELRARERLPTGLASVDEMLAGGLPVGQLIEISGGASSGKSTLAFSACLRALEKGQAAAWIAPAEGTGVGTRRPWPLAALEGNAALERLLMLRLSDGDAAMKATQLLLGCPGATALVVLDVLPRYRIHDAQLVKLQRLAERSSTALVLLTQHSAARPSLGAQVALRLSVKRQLVQRRLQLQVEVLRDKTGAARRIEEPFHGPDRLRVRGSL